MEEHEQFENNAEVPMNRADMVWNNPYGTTGSDVLLGQPLTAEQSDTEWSWHQNPNGSWGVMPSGCNESNMTEASSAQDDGGWGSSTQGPIQRWNDDQHQHCNMVDADCDDHAEMDDDVIHEAAVHTESTSFAQKVDPSEYNRQTREYTKQAVDALVQSPDYQRVYTRCKLCWCSWSEGQCTAGCAECGGFAMTRPCPVCGGKCGRVWRREVELSHSENEAYWDGECGLPADERAGYLQQMLMEPASEEDILTGLQQLHTQT